MPDTHDNLKQAFADLRVPHEMAVVVVGWSYEGSDLTRIVEGMTSLLHAQGFRRVVCLQGSENNKLDGLPIIDDWKQPVEQTSKSAAL